MILKMKDGDVKSKYKAVYKNLHSGTIKTFAVDDPTDVLTHFLQKNEDIFEMYILTSVIPLSE